MRKSAAFILATGVALAGGAAAPAQTTSIDFEFDHLVKRAGEPTGVGVSFVAKDGQEFGIATRVVARLQRGTKIDPGVPRACRATDEELLTSGIKACPKASRIGSGEAVVTPSTGGGEFELTISAFNGRRGKHRQLVFYLTRTGAREDSAVIRGNITGITRRRPKVTAPLPSTCLPGDDPDTPECDAGEAKLTRFTFTVPQLLKGTGAQQRSYITNPRRCPKSGQWRNRVVVSFEDGSETKASDAAPCRR